MQTLFWFRIKPLCQARPGQGKQEREHLFADLIFMEIFLNKFGHRSS